MLRSFLIHFKYFSVLFYMYKYSMVSFTILKRIDHLYFQTPWFKYKIHFWPHNFTMQDRKVFKVVWNTWYFFYQNNGEHCEKTVDNSGLLSMFDKNLRINDLRGILCHKEYTSSKFYLKNDLNVPSWNRSLPKSNLFHDTLGNLYTYSFFFLFFFFLAPSV